MTVTATMDTVWADYKATGDPELRNQLVLQYAPLVKYVAGRIRAGLPSSVESADLVSEGIFGLMDAIEKFDPERGWAFQTYAVPRIRGAIIDSIRSADWVPRSVRTRLRDIENARVALHHELGREPDDDELAGRAEISVRDLREVLGKQTQLGLVGEDELYAIGDTGPGIEDALEDEGTRQLLMHAVRGLPERDQVVIALYFFEGLTLAEIGQVLGVTESRVSQLRSRATRLLRELMTASLA